MLLQWGTVVPILSRVSWNDSVVRTGCQKHTGLLSVRLWRSGRSGCPDRWRSVRIRRSGLVPSQRLAGG